jgi:hypothetical protein
VKGYDTLAPSNDKPATFNPFAELSKMLNKDES